MKTGSLPSASGADGGCAYTGAVVLFDDYAPEGDELDSDFIAGQLWLAPARGLPV
jgi:hypothetical protein